MNEGGGGGGRRPNRACVDLALPALLATGRWQFGLHATLQYTDPAGIVRQRAYEHQRAMHRHWHCTPTPHWHCTTPHDTTHTTHCTCTPPHTHTSAQHGTASRSTAWHCTAPHCMHRTTHRTMHNLNARMHIALPGVCVCTLPNLSSGVCLQGLSDLAWVFFSW